MTPRPSFSIWPLLVLLVWLPIPLASNRPWAMGLFALASWVLASVYVWHGRFDGPRAGGSSGTSDSLVRQPRFWMVVGLLGAFAVLVAARQVAGVQGLLGDPADAFAVKLYLLCTLGYLGLALCVFAAVRQPQDAMRVLGALLAGGALQALIAAILLQLGKPHQWLFTDFPRMGRATGTYANPDHLAGYMELCLSAGLGLLLAQFSGPGQAAGGSAWQSGLRATLGFMLSAKMILRLVMVGLVAALVMTHSRMGNGAFFLGLLLMGGLLAIMSRQLRKPALWLVASMALIDLVIVGQWVGLERVVDRLAETAESTRADVGVSSLEIYQGTPGKEESIQKRLTVPRLSLPLVAEKPWLGWGGGNYYAVFPRVKPPGFPHLWDHAHNDYVEIAVDTGLVGLGLLLALAPATVWRAAKLLPDGMGSRNRGVAVAALMALFCMGVHSLVDFNLQIPANAATLVVLISLVWALPRNKPGRADAAAV